MAKAEKRKKRVDLIAGWLSEPMPRAELVAKVADELKCSRRGAYRALARVRRALVHRGVKAGDEAVEQVERLRRIAKEARLAGDFASQIAAERLLADVIGTKASEKVQIEMTPAQAALVALAEAAKRSRE